MSDRIAQLLTRLSPDESIRQVFWSELGYDRIDLPMALEDGLSRDDLSFLMSARLFGSYAECHVVVAEFAEQVVDRDRAQRFLALSQRLYGDVIVVLSSFAATNCLCVIPAPRVVGDRGTRRIGICPIRLKGRFQKRASATLNLLRTFDTHDNDLNRPELISNWCRAANSVSTDWPKQNLPFESVPLSQRMFWVGQFDLLSLEREQVTVKTISDSGPVIDRLSGSHLVKFRDVQPGNKQAFLDARNELVLHNQRLVVSIAKTYRNWRHLLEDCIQDGCLGLARAAELVDSSYGTKFSTYATWWIRQVISREHKNSSHLVRVPVHVTREYIQEHSLQIPTVTLSCDCHFEESEMAVDRVSLGPCETAEQYDRQEIIEGWLRSLTYREREIIKMRFGFGDGWPYTLEQTGTVLGVTRERIRQIEQKALKKIQRRAKNFRELTDGLP